LSRKSKCKGCETLLEKEEKYIYSGKTYCKNCYDKLQKERENYNQLLETIMNYFEIQVIDGLMYKQIKEYKEQFNYNYTGMTYTLWYCKEILNKKFDRKYGIALVKYEYNNAKDYFIKQQQIQNSVMKIKEPVTRKVKINLEKVFKKNSRNYLIDLENLIGGADNNGI
jgi:hypothetical protein